MWSLSNAQVSGTIQTETIGIKPTVIRLPKFIMAQNEPEYLAQFEPK